VKKSNVVEITKNDTLIGKIINGFQFTLRRMQGGLGFGISPDGKRDYNKIFGYGTNLRYSDYFAMYERHDFGHVIVDKIAKACWNELPKIMSGETQILKDEMDQLKKMGFFKALQRADRLNRIGNFSVLLIGMPDGLDLDKPLGSATDIQGMYFNPYNFNGIEILKQEDDPLSQRFGLPELYQLQTTNHGEKEKDSHVVSVVVHHSRIIHLAEGALDSAVEGTSALKAVWNSLINITKTTGGSAEAYFRNARQQLALEADKDARLKKGSEELAALKENVEDHMNGWDPVLRLQNMKANNLNIQMISPRETFDINAESISGETGIPIRILTGKGGGQTTGTEDRASWNALISDRRTDECDDYLMQGLQIMSNGGMFKLPDNAIVEWPPQASTNEKEAAEVIKNKAEAFKFVIEALSMPVGDEADATVVLETIGFEGIEIDTSDIEPEPTEPEDDSEENE